MLTTLANLVAEVLGNYPPDNVVEISMFGRAIFIQDRTVPAGQMWGFNPNNIVYEHMTDR